MINDGFSQQVPDTNKELSDSESVSDPINREIEEVKKRAREEERIRLEKEHKEKTKKAIDEALKDDAARRAENERKERLRKRQMEIRRSNQMINFEIILNKYREGKSDGT